jgi:phosphoribosylpyrophosphate synthetase
MLLIITIVIANMLAVAGVDHIIVSKLHLYLIRCVIRDAYI